MVWISRTYHCAHCTAGFTTAEEAEACESRHVVQPAIDGFRRETAQIFGKRQSQAVRRIRG